MKKLLLATAFAVAFTPAAQALTKTEVVDILAAAAMYSLVCKYEFSKEKQETYTWMRLTVRMEVDDPELLEAFKKEAVHAANVGKEK